MEKTLQQQYADLCANLGDLQFRKRQLSLQTADLESKIAAINSQIDSLLVAASEAAQAAAADAAKVVETTAG